MGNKGTTVLVSPTGEFRTRRAVVTPEHPNFVRNMKDSQSYPLEERPAFPISRPVPVDSIEGLMEPDPPQPVDKPLKWMVVGEDNGVWLYSPKMVLTPEEFMLRQRKRLDYREEGVQFASAKVIKSRADQGIYSFAAAAAVVVFCVCALMVCLIILQYKFSPQMGSIGALAMVGLTFPTLKRGKKAPEVLDAPGPRQKHREPKVKRTRAKKIIEPRVRCYIYNTDDGMVAHKSAPLALIQETFKNIHIYRHDISSQRRLWTICAPVGVGAVAGSLMWAASSSGLLTFLMIFAALLSTPLPVWVCGPRLIRRLNPLLTPFTCFYLREGENGEQQLIPIRHTLGRGVDPAIYDLIKDTIMERQRQLLKERGIEQDVQYFPTVNRATDLHQNLDAHLHRLKYKFPRSLERTIQIGSLATMAFCSIGVLIFVAFGTVE